MFRIAASALCAATLLSGCAVDPKVLAGAGAGANSILGIFTTTAQLDQQLVEDTIKQDAVLRYIDPSKKCTDNPGFDLIKQRTYRQARNIQREELAALKAGDAQYQFLLKYAKAFDAIVKESADASQAINDLVQAGNAIAGTIPSPYAAGYIAVATTAGKAINAAGVLVTAGKLREAAKNYKKPLALTTALLKTRFPAMDRQLTAKINVWRACTEEKFQAMRSQAVFKQFPTSAVELDSAYSGFQAQYRAFVVAAPEVGTLLNDIEEANDAVANSFDIATMRTSIENLVAAVNAAHAVYTAAGALPR